MNIETRYASTSGATIAYQVAGSKPIDLLYIPGWFLNPEVVGDFLPTRRYLERLLGFVRLITVEKRGFGMSERLSDALPTVADRVADVAAVADRETLTHAPVMGTFEGGALALLYAATAPERVSAVILVDSFARLQWRRSLFGALGNGAADAARTLWHVFEDGKTWREWFAPELMLTDAQAKQLGRGLRLSANPAVIEPWLELVGELNAEPVVDRITAPVLVIHRAGDCVVDVSHGRRLANLLPNATYLEMPGSDHVPWDRDLDAIVGEVEQFLTGTRRPDIAPDVTVLFTDIVSSTEQLAAMGDRAWKELLQRHDVVTDDVLARFGGRKVKATGDGLLAELPTPTDAVRCAAAVVSALRALGIGVRAGIHVGPCEAYGDDLIGMTVNIGARLMSQAGPGEIVVSEPVRDRCDAPAVDFCPLSPRSLKGVPGTWAVYAVRAH